MDNVQNCDSYVNIPSSETCTFYLQQIRSSLPIMRDANCVSVSAQHCTTLPHSVTVATECVAASVGSVGDARWPSPRVQVNA
jgi:hypothetical protein